MGKEIIGKPLVTVLRSGHSNNAPLEDVVKSARGDMSVPRDLAAVVARKYRFVVSVSRKSFDAESRQSSFQVHRIDADLGKQSGSSALRRGHLPMVSPRKSVSDVTALSKHPFVECSSSANIPPDVSRFSDPVRALPSLPTPPSVNKNITLRTKSVAPASSVAKSLFQDGEDKEQAVDLGDKGLEDTGDFSETDQTMKEDAVVGTESLNVTPPSNEKEKRRRTPSGKGASAAALKKPKP